VDPCSLAGFTIETELAAEKIRDHCMDNMQAKSGSALIATCREERVEGFAPDA
jgi:hypothetical protein